MKNARDGDGLDKYRTGTVVSINVSGGGVPKGRIAVAKVSRLGLQNDAQDDIKHHGGPERAICVYSLERIQALQGEGHPIEIGTVGENVTVEGIDWDLVVPGSRIRLGEEVLLEVAPFTDPCKTIRESFIRRQIRPHLPETPPRMEPRLCASAVGGGNSVGRRRGTDRRDGINMQV